MGKNASNVTVQKVRKRCFRINSLRKICFLRRKPKFDQFLKGTALKKKFFWRYKNIYFIIEKEGFVQFPYKYISSKLYELQIN